MVSPSPSVVEPAGIAQALVKWPRWPSNMASWRDDLGEKLRARSQEMAHRPIGLAVKALGRPVAEERMARGLAHNVVSEWDHGLEGGYGARDGALAASHGGSSSAWCWRGSATVAGPRSPPRHLRGGAAIPSRPPYVRTQR